MHRYLQTLVLSLLLIVFPFTTVFAQSEYRFTQVKTLRLSDFLDGNTYHGIFELVDAIESGRIERECSLEEQQKVMRFFVHLAKMAAKENPALQKELNAFLAGSAVLFEKDFFDKGNGFSYLMPGSSDTSALSEAQANWISKRCRYLRRFCHRNRKAIIISAVVVVAAAAIVTAFVMSSAAASGAAISSAKALENQVQTSREQAAADGLFDAGALQELSEKDNDRVI